MASERSKIRGQLRSRRRALSESERRRAALGLSRLASGSAVFRNSRRIAFYLSNDGEQDPLPLIHRALSMRKQCYLPMLAPLSSKSLWFLPFEPGDPLVNNRFGIPEPLHGPRHRVSAYELDLILLPLVAFDNHGNRLGMGGGFYDRTLEFLRRREHWRRPFCYGVAYEFQQIDRLSAAPWDIPLDGCLTETRVIRFKRREAIS